MAPQGDKPLQLLLEIQRNLASFEVYLPEEVEVFQRIWQTRQDDSALDEWIEPVLKRFEELYEEPQRQFKELLTEYVRLYPRHAAALPSSGASLAGLYDLARFLLTRLPTLREKVRLEVAERSAGYEVDHDRQAGALTRAARERELEREIRRPLPAKLVRRFRELNALRQAEALAPEEHRELIQLTEHLERLHVERMERLSRLASLQNRPLRALMDHLGVRPLPHA